MAFFHFLKKILLCCDSDTFSTTSCIDFEDDNEGNVWRQKHSVQVKIQKMYNLGKSKQFFDISKLPILILQVLLCSKLHLIALFFSFQSIVCNVDEFSVFYSPPSPNPNSHYILLASFFENLEMFSNFHDLIQDVVHKYI